MSWIVNDATRGPSTRAAMPLSAPPREGSMGRASAKAKWEKAPWSRYSDLTGERAGSGRPARAKETSRAPKLCPIRWTRTSGSAWAMRPSRGPRPCLPDHPGALLHLEVGELAQRLLGAVPQPREGVADAGGAALAGLGTASAK